MQNIFRFTGPLGDWIVLLQHGNEGRELSIWKVLRVFIPIILGAVAVMLFDATTTFAIIAIASWLFGFIKWSQDKRAFEKDLTLDQMFAPHLIDVLSFNAAMVFLGGLMAFVGSL